MPGTDRLQRQHQILIAIAGIVSQVLFAIAVLINPVRGPLRFWVLGSGWFLIAAALVFIDKRIFQQPLWLASGFLLGAFVGVVVGDTLLQLPLNGPFQNAQNVMTQRLFGPAIGSTIGATVALTVCLLRRRATSDDSGNQPSQSTIEATSLSALTIKPDSCEDFDPERCQQLLDTLVSKGAESVDDVLRLGVRVTLEQFFTGNRCKHSIAANVCPDPPFDTAKSWFDHLKSVREHPQVQDVLVQIYMVEPYEDGRVGMWPYSDTIWVYAELDRSSVASLLAPIDPDEVRDASINDPNWNLEPPDDVPLGATPYWVWWD